MHVLQDGIVEKEDELLGKNLPSTMMTAVYGLCSDESQKKEK